ncbi:hypothetical protein INT47_009304 [Mucor saturninus]|uniref:Uncharacterized protein n=1 Tax=Mucor saturninus TaxID=64648 RepID=A0A8H7QHW1_9FUNG|nr:hypothetical protein INT47_009304 [Mucor saturninus]
MDGTAIQQQLFDLVPQPFSCQASYIDSFFTQPQVVFLADSSKFSNNDENKVLYTIKYLAGTALNYVLAFINDIGPSNKPEMLKNFTTFTRLLYSAFADSNPTVKAEGVLGNLKHTGSAAVYAFEFKRLSILLSWNDDGLDTNKDELARCDPIEELNALMNISIDIDNRLFSSNKQTLDFNAVCTHNSNFLSLGPLTQDEKNRRRRLTLCVYCAIPGYFTASFPNKNRNATSGSYISTLLMNDANMEVVPIKNYAAATTRVFPEQVNHVSSIKRSSAVIETLYKEAIKKSRESIEIIPVILDSQGTLIETTALIDSRSSGSFVSSSLVKQHQLHSVRTNGTTYRIADSSEHVTFGASTLLLNIHDINHNERDGIISFTCLWRGCKEKKENKPVHASPIGKQQPQLSALCATNPDSISGDDFDNVDPSTYCKINYYLKYFYGPVNLSCLNANDSHISAFYLPKLC